MHQGILVILKTLFGVFTPTHSQQPVRVKRPPAERPAPYIMFGLALMLCTFMATPVKADDFLHRGGESLKSPVALFQTQEERSDNIQPFTKWTRVLSRTQADYVLKGAQEQPLLQQVAAFDQPALSIKDKARHVNDLMNTLEYVGDQENYGRSDYWATPAEFMARGGDCEDFAIAKYAALKALGVPENRLRLAIVHDTVKDIPHAILVVYAENGPIILDNQIKELRSALQPGRYRPIFSINANAWWLHTDPQEIRIASAQ